MAWRKSKDIIAEAKNRGAINAFRYYVLHSSEQAVEGDKGCVGHITKRKSCCAHSTGQNSSHVAAKSGDMVGAEHRGNGGSAGTRSN